MIYVGAESLAQKLPKDPPIVTITCNDGQLTMKLEFGPMAKASSFPLDGREVEEEHLWGGKFKVWAERRDCFIIFVSKQEIVFNI